MSFSATTATASTPPRRDSITSNSSRLSNISHHSRDSTAILHLASTFGDAELKRKIWLNINSEDPSGVELHDRLVKLYEVVGIMSALLCGFATVFLERGENEGPFDSSGFSKDAVYQLAVCLSVTFGILSVIACVVLLSQLIAVKNSHIELFVVQFAHMFNTPVIYMLISIHLFLGGLCLYNRNRIVRVITTTVIVLGALRCWMMWAAMRRQVSAWALAAWEESHPGKATAGDVVFSEDEKMGKSGSGGNKGGRSRSSAEKAMDFGDFDGVAGISERSGA